MLQIRLSKGSSADGSGGAAKSPLPAETVTVACPDHLVIADLPVAKSLGAITSSAGSSVRSVGRRSRRIIGQKVHFCVRCDFPIAIYGRLIPCDHAFCLACSRSDACCYLCDERVQKIQTIKLLEGIFLCAAPHCLKSFLKKSDFELHVNEVHADLLHRNSEREGGNETDAMNTPRQSSVDPYKQSSQPESSTAHGPARSVGVSPSTNMQPQDRDEKSRRNQLKDQPSPRLPPLQPRPPPYPSQQLENHTPQGPDIKPTNWFQQPQHSDSQNGRRDTDQPSQEKLVVVKSEPMFTNYTPHPPQPPNYPHPLSGNNNQGPMQAQFSYPSFPADGSQPYYAVPYDMSRPGMAQDAGSTQGSVMGIPPPQDAGSTQGSVMGIPPPTVMPTFPDNAPRPWGMTMMGVPFNPMQMGQGVPEGFMAQGDPQGGMQFFQGVDYGRMSGGLAMNPPHPGKELEQQGDGKSVMAPLPLPVVAPPMLPPPPPLVPRPMSQQLNGNSLSSGGGVGLDGQAFGWPNNNR